MKYRPDVDGLRALAVVPVVLFHADVQAFSGGFVGVDVFLVISGYLITRLLLADFAQDRFSLRHFYTRRVRRIFPALLAMVLVTLVAGFFLLLPGELREAGRATEKIAYFFPITCSGIRKTTTGNRTPWPLSRCCTHGRWLSKNSSTSSSLRCWHCGTGKRAHATRRRYCCCLPSPAQPAACG